ncbi:MAG: hypothetical protein U9Q85_03920 [Patescibacteria group bacterium]|nr:hypothetical protein [Patescibacteria group bacterium]
MKKIVFLTLIIGVLLISGCTQTQTQEQDNTVNKDDFAMRRPDFGQPKRELDIRGLVKSIIGNEITVLKIERLQSNQKADSENINNDEEKKTPTGTTGIRIPGMGRGLKSGGITPDADVRAAMLERMKEMSTGEETILIPIGIQMLKPGDNAEKMEMVEATFEDINENKMIQVWLNQNISDRKIAEFVLITR